MNYQKITQVAIGTEFLRHKKTKTSKDKVSIVLYNFIKMFGVEIKLKKFPNKRKDGECIYFFMFKDHGKKRKDTHVSFRLKKSLKLTLSHEYPEPDWLYSFSKLDIYFIYNTST